MKIAIKALLNKEIEGDLKFWAGKDPLNPRNNKVLAVKRGIFTSFYSFPEGKSFDSINIIRKVSNKNGVLTIFLDLEVSSEKELQDLYHFEGEVEELPEEYKADLSREPAYRTFVVPVMENIMENMGRSGKSLQLLIEEKKEELGSVRQQIIDAQADEEYTLLPKLRSKRDQLKKEIETLESNNA